MMTGIRLLIYLGVAFMLLGTYIIMVDALTLDPTMVSAFGAFLCAIGVTISFVGFLGKDNNEVTPEIAERVLLGAHGYDPMSYLNAATEIAKENRKKLRGNRAIGFVLISVGVFTVTPLVVIPTVFSCCNGQDIASFFAFLGLILASPISILGLICLTFGMLFRKLSSH